MKALKYSILLTITYLTIAFVMWLLTYDESLEHLNNFILKILE